MKKISESVWGDVLDRGTGETIRKEDDVNLLDVDGLYDYIKSKYEKRIFYLDKYTGNFNLWEICVDIIGNISLKAIYNEDGEIDHIVLSWSGVGVKIRHSFLWDLSEKFNMENVGTYRRVIKEKDDTCTNKTYIDIIEFFLNNKDNMLVNESTWGGMLDRGAGETVRKEDKLTDEEMETLKQYISHYAYEIVYGEGRGAEACKLDEFCDFLERNMESDPKIIDYVKTFWFDDICDLVNDAIEDRQNDPQEEYVNESTWGEILDRGAGETVRKEEFTEEFIDKLESELIGFTMSVVYYIKNYELTFDGFYKYLEEIESPDEIKKIIYYVKTHKNECDKLLEKDIKSENKYLDEKVNGYLLRFVDNIVYDEKYHNTFSDIKKFASEIFKGHKSSYHFNINEKLVFKDKSKLFNDYIEDKWKDGSLKQKIDDLIKNENDEISKYGFVKEPGKTISETIDDWWDSLDEDKRNDLGWDEFGDDAEEEYYADHNPKYNEYAGEDFDVDEWWANAYGIRRVKIYCSEHSKTNESTWRGILDRGAGETKRKEDEVLNDDDFLMLREIAKMFKNVLNRSANEPWSGTCDDFIKYINLRKKEHFWNDMPDEVYDKVIKFVKDNWGDCTDIQEFIDKCLSNINECEGVPGGVTPASVGGMGAAYFPGPDGTPGSGDLPSPTGIVYHQVAPYTMFLKQIKKKKKKSKKFRKEDEPCVHSPNAKVYDYVDDFREYVDRTYNNIDRRK